MFATKPSDIFNYCACILFFVVTPMIVINERAARTAVPARADSTACAHYHSTCPPTRIIGVSAHIAHRVMMIINR